MRWYNKATNERMVKPLVYIGKGACRLVTRKALLFCPDRENAPMLMHWRVSASSTWLVRPDFRQSYLLPLRRSQSYSQAAIRLLAIPMTKERMILTTTGFTSLAAVGLSWLEVAAMNSIAQKVIMCAHCEQKLIHFVFPPQ